MSSCPSLACTHGQQSSTSTNWAAWQGFQQSQCSGLSLRSLLQIARAEHRQHVRSTTYRTTVPRHTQDGLQVGVAPAQQDSTDSCSKHWATACCGGAVQHSAHMRICTLNRSMLQQPIRRHHAKCIHTDIIRTRAPTRCQPENVAMPMHRPLQAQVCLTTASSMLLQWLAAVSLQ